MESERFDTLTRSLVGSGSRRVILRSILTSGVVTLLGGLAAEQTGARCRRRRRCNGVCCRRRQICGNPTTQTCVTGRGTCERGADSCASGSPIVCKSSPNSTVGCLCYRGVESGTRCGTQIGLANACTSDQHCQALYSHIPGVFCAQAGGDCGDNFCVEPCPRA